jgi:Tfp pilus assembly protein PilN
MTAGPLRLDYRRSRGPARPALDAGLMAVGVGVLAVVLVACFELSGELQETRGQIEDLQLMSKRRANTSQATSTDAGADAEAVRANAIKRQLNLPWDELFKAIEASKGDSVALVSIAPDAQLRQLKLAGEAKSFADMLEYVKRLNGVSMFESAYLLDHGLARQGSGEILRFTIVATWKGNS